jgi:hypothetical protein
LAGSTLKLSNNNAIVKRRALGYLEKAPSEIMIQFIKQVLTYTLISAFVVVGLPRPLKADVMHARPSALPPGKASARAAAKPDLSMSASMKIMSGSAPMIPAAVSLLEQPVLIYGAFAYMQPDSSEEDEFEFPDDKENHVTRDVTVFVIASIFVAYFIIKVFIEEDPPENTDDGGGKTIPGS